MSPRQLSLFDEEPAAGPAAGALPSATPSAVLSAPPVPAVPAPAAASPVGTPAEAAPPAAPPPPRPARPAHAPVAHHPQANREVSFGPHRIGYLLRRARRRSIGFVIGTEGLTVSAPRWVGVREIESALQEKAAWILKKLAEQRERAQRLEASRIEWRDGATLPFLGETVILLLDPRVTGAVLHAADETLPGVPRLTLHLGLAQAAEPAQIRDAVQGWLQRQARRIFEQRVGHFAPQLGVRVRRLALSAAATRWGSASADGSIRLNWRLVHFAMPVIDYVVAHELAHLREMNHSPAFWDVVRTVVPDFESHRHALRSETLPAFE